jgi:hypothetical protein
MITFENKIAVRQNLLPRVNSITADDINEIKESVNELFTTSTWTVELIDLQTVDVYAPVLMKINSVVKIVGVPTVTLFVNNVAYILGENIEIGAKITVTASIASVINLIITN